MAHKKNLQFILDGLQELEELGGTYNLQDYIDTLSLIINICSKRRTIAMELLAEEYQPIQGENNE